MKNKLSLLILSILSLLTPVQVVAALPPQSGDINVNGIVAGPPPANPPNIDSPTNGAVFQNSLIPVTGSCDAGLLVRVFKNNIFAGSTLCQAGGTYSLQIDLVLGNNVLLARQYDFLDQASPDSNTVQVTYRPPNPPPPGQPSITAPTDQVVIAFDFRIVGIFPGRRFALPISFGGGTGPYAVSVDWGDGNFDQKSQPEAGDVKFEHTYDKPGYYVVKMRVTDVNGNTAYMEVVLVVNGELKTKTPNEIYNLKSGFLEPAWPIFAVIAAIATAFFVGEFYQARHDKRAFLSYMRGQKTKPKKKPAKKRK